MQVFVFLSPESRFQTETWIRAIVIYSNDTFQDSENI